MEAHNCSFSLNSAARISCVCIAEKKKHEKIYAIKKWFQN